MLPAGAGLSRARSAEHQRRRHAEGGGPARGGPALHPLLQLVAVHLRPRQRRGLRLGRLLGRRLSSPRRAPRRRRTASRSSTACPRRARSSWFDMMAIPADAPNPEGALAWINFIMEPQITADITNYVSYANANDASLPLVDEAIKNDPSIFPPDGGDGEAVPDGGLRREARPDDDPALDQGRRPGSKPRTGRAARAHPMRRRAEEIADASRFAIAGGAVLAAAPALAAARRCTSTTGPTTSRRTRWRSSRRRPGSRSATTSTTSNEVLEAKLLAGNSGYDVVVPTSTFLRRQMPAGVYRPLDRAQAAELGQPRRRR